MNDLGAALTDGGNMLMLGGGNPARIPSVEEHFNRRMRHLLDSGCEFSDLIGNYERPQGHRSFVESLAAMLGREFGWPLTGNNIAITNGSQSAFFALFNMFGGEMPDGGFRRILLPLAPEYIGYSDIGVAEDLFVSEPAKIHELDSTLFKYGIDFDRLEVGENIGAICVSRPTNPTGNVLTNAEMDRLAALAAQHEIPLIVDGAYGTPFPNIIFTDAQPAFTPHTILCLSLSKLGLPGVRCGIVIGDASIIRAITSMNAITNLAVGSLGPLLTLDMIRSGEIIDLGKRTIQPYYRERAEQAITYLRSIMTGYPLRIHKAEGAIFLWLWFEGLPISSLQLYERLKKNGVLVIAGEYFFPGLRHDYRHSHECIRVTYAQDWSIVRPGLDGIAAQVKKAYDEH